MSKFIYLDTSTLIKLYIEERETEQVASSVNRFDGVLFSEFHRTEIMSALCAKVGRNHLESETLHKVISVLDEDIEAGLLVSLPIDWDTIWKQTQDLSLTYGRDTLARALDTIHVAIALELHALKFISGDKRQIKTGNSSGLDVEII